MDPIALPADSVFDFRPSHAFHDKPDSANDNSFSDFDSFPQSGHCNLSQPSAALYGIGALHSGNFSPVTQTQATNYPEELGPCQVCNLIFCDCDLSNFDHEWTAPNMDDPNLHTSAFLPPGDHMTLPNADTDHSTAKLADDSSMINHFSCERRPQHPDSSPLVITLQEASRESPQTDLKAADAAPPEVTPKPVRKRARIKDATYAMLDKHFGINAYPKAGEISSLAKATKLTAKEIKTWFSNARSRRKPGNAASKSANTFHSTTPYSPQDQTIDRQNATSLDSSRQQHTVSKENLKALNRISPVASVSSLERYMACPLNEEAVSTTALEEATKAASTGLTRSLSGSTLRHEIMPVTPSGYTFPLPREYSRAGSVQSFGSAQSRYSYGSVHSFDSRGSRRGRKQWVRANSVSMGVYAHGRSDSVDSMAVNYDPRAYISTSVTGHVDPPINSPDISNLNTPIHENGGIFCTWPTCSAKFKHRSEWIRHEGPLHYQPYRWLCCSEIAASVPLPQCYICGEQQITTGHIAVEHFSSCVHRKESDRDFWRKDHLADHIRRVHLPGLNKPVPNSLLSAWKIKNPAMPNIHLRCGFCGISTRNWEDRNDHVFAHFKEGVSKSAWFDPALPW